MRVVLAFPIAWIPSQENPTDMVEVEQWHGRLSFCEWKATGEPPVPLKLSIASISHGRDARDTWNAAVHRPERFLESIPH